jgi:hypothetical protein
MLDLKELTKELLAERCQDGGFETDKDKAVVEAIDQLDLGLEERKQRVVTWLNHYKVFMGFPRDQKTAVAEEVVAFADERRERLLHRDQEIIVLEFLSLQERIGKVGLRTKAGKAHGITSLTSKALWCCYPEDVPIFDRNAAGTLKIISRLCKLPSTNGKSEYGGFIDMWFRVYNEIDSVIVQADLRDCPYRIRVLDRLLWYLGQDSYYGEKASFPTPS